MITNLTFQGDIISTKSPKLFTIKFAVAKLPQKYAEDISIGEEMSGDSKIMAPSMRYILFSLLNHF